jgi:LCP family protein required for cell wall assembly
MECQAARRLLSQGVTPGADTTERKLLGFHLASCVHCRTFRANLQDDLLAGLLMQADVAPAPKPQAAPKPRPQRPVERERVEVAPAAPPPSLIARFGKIAAFSILVLCLLGVALSASPTVRSAFRTWDNVNAMVIPQDPGLVPALGLAETPTPTIEPTATASPEPTATSTPEATATSTPTPSPTPVLATPTPTAPPIPAAGDAVTVLLLGSDIRPHETGPARTDAIMVARIDPQSKRVALLSLPRDLMVEVPGYGYTRINAASVWGDVYGHEGGAIELSRATVAHLLGIEIDYVVLIEFQGFIEAIDALGGVLVDVPTELYDSQFPTMDYGYKIAHFLPGKQLMDGDTALTYSRIRHPDSDFARMKRQQQVVIGFLRQLRQGGVHEQIEQLEEVTTVLRNYLRTTIPAERMLGLAWALRNVEPENIQTYSLDASMVSFGVGDDRWAQQALPGTIDLVRSQLMGE